MKICSIVPTGKGGQPMNIKTLPDHADYSGPLCDARQMIKPSIQTASAVQQVGRNGSRVV